MKVQTKILRKAGARWVPVVFLGASPHNRFHLMTRPNPIPITTLGIPLQEWASTPTPESARLLIRTYRESEWRTTRLEVLKALSNFNDLRSFLFLVERIELQQDLAEQMAAIGALSHRRTRSAQAYLRQQFKQAPDTLKAPLAYALGQSQDSQVIPALIREWSSAAEREDGLLIKSLVIALGEQKAFEALPQIREYMARSSGLEPDVMLACLLALARLERDPQKIQMWESAFLADSLQQQIFKSALSQVQIRSQFKLEDYLSKIFQSAQPHPVLPLELRAFDQNEVEVGLSVFDSDTQPKRFLFALQGLQSERRGSVLKKWLQQKIESGMMTEADWVELFPEMGLLLDPVVLKMVRDEIQSVREPASLELQLKWLELLAPFENIEEQGRSFLLDQEDSIAIRFLNLWSEWAIVKGIQGKTIEEWLDRCDLKPMVFARLVRACAELKHPIQKLSQHWPVDFKQAALRSSVLFYLESHPDQVDLKEFLNQILLLTQLERENLGQRILGVIESVAEAAVEKKKSLFSETRLIDVLKMFAGHASPEIQIGLLKILRHQPFPGFEDWAISQLKSSHGMVELNAIIALKGYAQSREASEALVDKLSSAIRSVQGRALDTLCSHTSLLARRAVLDFLTSHLDQEEVVDKVYRSFDPERRGGSEFVERLDALLQVNPDHPQWEKLVALRDRLQQQTQNPTEMSSVTQAQLNVIDQKLTAVIPQFRDLDAMTQSALRAAEQPFLEEGTHLLPVDKAPTVLEYCKALDLILDRQLGQKILFPKLDSQLHDFQTLWHRLGFGEDYPNLDRVVTGLGLQGRISPEHFPLHKAKMMCATFFNGKILQDRFKIFDGLRAWAVIFLIFARKLPVSAGGKPLLSLPHATDEKCVSIAKRLMTLQDLRNPAAHRQTYMDIASVTAVRNESILLLNTILNVLK